MHEAAWPIPLLLGGLAMFSGAAVLSSCASHGPAPASASGLEPDEFWGEAEVIFEDAAFLWASIAGEPLMVTGNLLYGEGAGDSISTAFVLGTGPVAPPPVDYPMARLFAASDPQGRVHLLWGRATDPGWTPSDGLLPFHVQEVWYASRDGEWSAPELVYSGVHIEWIDGAVALMVDDTRVYAAVRSFGMGSRLWGRVLLVRDENGTWEATDPFPDMEAGSFVVLARGASGILMMQIGASEQESVQQILISHGSLEGDRWDPPRPVMEAERPSRLSVQAYGERVHLTWREGISTGTRRIRTALSDDFGRTWSDGGSVDLNGFHLRSSYTADPCGHVHVTSEIFLGVTPRVVQHRWSMTDGWSEAIEPFSGAPGQYPYIATLPSGRLLLTHSALHLAGDPPAWAYTQVLSTTEPCR